MSIILNNYSIWSVFILEKNRNCYVRSNLQTVAAPFWPCECEGTVVTDLFRSLAWWLAAVWTLWNPCQYTNTNHSKLLMLTWIIRQSTIAMFNFALVETFSSKCEEWNGTRSSPSYKNVWKTLCSWAILARCCVRCTCVNNNINNDHMMIDHMTPPAPGPGPPTRLVPRLHMMIKSWHRQEPNLLWDGP